jgi:hypothetical protein
VVDIFFSFERSLKFDHRSFSTIKMVHGSGPSFMRSRDQYIGGVFVNQQCNDTKFESCPLQIKMNCLYFTHQKLPVKRYHVAVTQAIGPCKDVSSEHKLVT